MQLGKLASFAGEDGKPKQVTITRAHIEALLSFVGNRAIPMHLTHEWADAQDKANADSVEMESRIGALKNFRKDNVGDLIADAYLKSGSTRNDILFGAEHNPEDNMLSAVFDYRKDDPTCMPLNFRAADVVPQGAAVTALFKQTNTATMAISIDDLKEVCSTPEGKEMLRAAIKGHDKAQDASEENAAAEMESDAGVTEGDKKDSDKSMPAMMRASVRIARSIKRQTATLTSTKDTILAEAKTLVTAEATALLGKSGIPALADAHKTGDEVETALAAYVATGCNRGTAILRLAKDKPALYNTAKKAGKI